MGSHAAAPRVGATRARSTSSPPPAPRSARAWWSAPPAAPRSSGPSPTPDAAPACATSTGALAPPDVLEPTSVQLGSLLALLVQRRALGLAAALEGLEVSRTGLLSALTAEACTHRPPAVPDPVLAELLRHLAAALPDEGCAVLVGRDDRVRVVPMENAQAAQHARDPEAFPRTARTAFSLDPRAWLAVLREADRAGERVLAIAHSHPEGGSGFSAEESPPGSPRWAASRCRAWRTWSSRLRRAARSGRWAVWTDSDFLETACPLPA